jgi:hypothetical protein
MSEFERQRVVTSGGADYIEVPGRRDAYESGWLMFAGLMIFFVGLWNTIEGGIAFFRSAFFTGTPVFGTLAFWAAVWIGLGIVQMVIAYAIMSGNNVARWLGVVIVVVSMIVQMLAIAVYPWWSLFVMAIDLLILYGLIVYGRPVEEY